MQHHHFNILNRRAFLGTAAKAGMAAALASLVDIPLVMKRALAEGTIGLNGKKLLFIWLRGANDGLNSLVPILDPAYATARPSGGTNIGIPMDPGTTYSDTGACDFPVNTNPNAATYSYLSGIRTGNGFAALHPSLKFLAPVYNAGHLAFIHRVGYPRQSRSHFDSQNYWENGNPNNNVVKNGIFYRAMVESGLANTAPLTGVSIQSSLPLILRGDEAAMTNLTDPNRYALLGIPNNATGIAKAGAFLTSGNLAQFSPKKNRDLLRLQYGNLNNTLSIFDAIDFTENGNVFRDNEKTDGDTVWYPQALGTDDGLGYYLFPTNSEKNGGWRRPDGSTTATKYVVGTNHHGFFNNLKAAALVLNKTDAIIAGTEFGGFDTHSTQGGPTGTHAELNKAIGWAIYGLRKYFTHYADKATWDNMIVVTLSEFGRTTRQNSDLGTDHAEASVMWVAGGGVKGYNAGNSSAVFGCSPSDPIPWITGPADQAGGVDGSMFGVSNSYLKRSADYRSVLGEIIRKHLGATQNQLNRIIPGYANPAENLFAGGTSTDGTPIRGELGIL